MLIYVLIEGPNPILNQSVHPHSTALVSGGIPSYAILFHQRSQHSLPSTLL